MSKKKADAVVAPVQSKQPKTQVSTPTKTRGMTGTKAKEMGLDPVIYGDAPEAKAEDE